MNLQNLSLAEAEQILDRMSGVVRLGHLMHERDGVMPRIDFTSPPFIGFPVFDAAAHDPAPAIAPAGADRTGGVGDASRVEKPEAPRYHASAPEAGPSSPWTESDDATLIAAVLEQVKAGKSMRDGYQLAGTRMGRSFIACQTRGKQKLGERIRAAIEAEGLTKPEPGKRAQPAPCRGNIRKTAIIGKAEADAILLSREKERLTVGQLAERWDRTLGEISGLLQRSARRGGDEPVDRSEPVSDPVAPAPADKNPIKTEAPVAADEIAKAPEAAPADQEPAPVAEPAQPRAGGLILPPDATIPSGQRAIREHLNRLGNPGAFDTDTDLELVEGLSNGQKLPEIAADFGLDTSACKQRFERLTSTIRGDKGRVTIDGQRHLLAELRARVAAGRVA